MHRIRMITGTTMALLLSLSMPAFSDEQSDLESLVLTDEEFSKVLARNSGVAVPVFFGCNRLVRNNPKLPVACLHGNLTAKVDRVVSSAVSIINLIERMPTTGWWESALNIEDLALINWSIEPRYFWHTRSSRRSTLCVIGRNANSTVNEFFGAECLKTFPANHSQEEGSTLQIKFEDAGIFSVFGQNSKRDETELKVFVSYFAMNVWSY